MKRYTRAKVYIDSKTTLTMNIYYQPPFDTFDGYYFINFEGERLDVVWLDSDGWLVSVLRG